MNAEYPATEVPATPAYVMALFRAAFSDIPPTGEWPNTETTVSDLALEVSDLIWSWHELVAPLNDFAGLDLSSDEWEPALSPMDDRTVGELCQFIALRMGTRPVIRPWRHIGGECLPAGAFLTARAILVQYGAAPEAVTPSAPLGEYLHRFGPGWVFDLARMAPGRLPPVERRFVLQSCGCVAGAIGFAFMLLGAALRSQIVVGCCGASFLLIAFSILLLNMLLPCRFRIGELTTFRDLAYALAGQEPLLRIKPNA